MQVTGCLQGLVFLSVSLRLILSFRHSQGPKKIGQSLLCTMHGGHAAVRRYAMLVSRWKPKTRCRTCFNEARLVVRCGG